MKATLTPSLLLLLAAALPSRADFTFTVTTDTSPLIGQVTGPFSFDFQFNGGSGSGDANNTVNLSAFNFNGGSFTGVPTLMGGALAGLGSISLTDTSFFNELFQRFTPGNSLSFTVSMTTAVDAGGTPDQFSFAILDSTLAETPTQGPVDAFVTVDIDSANPTIQTFSTDLGRTTIDIGSPTIGGVAGVPESGVPIVLTGFVWAAGLLIRRRASSAWVNW